VFTACRPTKGFKMIGGKSLAKHLEDETVKKTQEKIQEGVEYQHTGIFADECTCENCTQCQNIGMSERPNESKYYDAGEISVIDYMKSKLTPEQYKGFLLGNVLKYSGRANFKGTFKDDVRKCATYSRWLDELVTVEK